MDEVQRQLDELRKKIEQQEAQIQEAQRVAREEAVLRQQEAKLRQRAERQAEREAALRRQEEAQRQQAERQAEQEAARRLDAEQELRLTNLPEHLHNCHNYLFLGINIGAKESSTRGGFTSPERKRRPIHIRRWDSFGALQLETWEKLMTLEIMNHQHFQSRSTVRDNGLALGRKALGSELDLHYFARAAVQEPITNIVAVLASNSAARRRFGLRGAIAFENHANTLSDDTLLSTNQICVYNTSQSGRAAAFIVEYKPPHKFTLETIKTGLREMNVDDIVTERPDDNDQTKCSRAVAAVITQTFSYMVAVGLAYGYIYTGEAFIFLHIGRDPRTVFYFLAVPRDHVGTSTGWSPSSNGSNRLHLTAVGQALAFTLRALQAAPYGQAWHRKIRELPVWESVLEDIFDDLPKAGEIDHSLFVPTPQKESDFIRSSPVRLRQRSIEAEPQQALRRRRSSDEESPSDLHSPSSGHLRPRPALAVDRDDTDSADSDAQDTVETGQQRSYCTHTCLQGLLQAGELDRECPNVQDHGVDKHSISGGIFLRMMRTQLAQSLDTDVHQTGLQGARGAFFQLTLSKLGYTVAAKLYPDHFRQAFRHEETVYLRLRSIQGVHIPVCLGSIRLKEAYRYHGKDLIHVLFLSYAGERLWRSALPAPPTALIAQASVAITSIHAEQVLHGDVALRNLVWDRTRRRLAVIDFDRATLLPQRAALSIASGNVVRKRLELTGKRIGALKVDRRRRGELGVLRSEINGVR